MGRKDELRMVGVEQISGHKMLVEVGVESTFQFINGQKMGFLDDLKQQSGKLVVSLCTA